MKFALVIACLMMVAYVHGSPRPAPPINRPEETYAWYCQTPKCPKTGDVDLYFPRDCNEYVKCTNGVAKVVPCPPDTQFNEALGKCTDLKSAKCLQCWQRLYEGGPPADN